jgi:hypothetical protein
MADRAVWLESFACLRGLRFGALGCVGMSVLCHGNLAAKRTMAYCTFNRESDVFVLEAPIGAKYVCHNCKLLNDGRRFRSADPATMIVHLGEHLAAGHKVPDRAFARLWGEREAGDD